VRRALGRTALGAAALAASCLLAWACSSLPDKSPTQPDPGSPTGAPAPNPNPVPTPTPTLGNVAPTPATSPSPSPQPSPDSSPSPSAPPPGAEACGSPTPPPLSSINVKVHLRGGDAWILDSTPLVGPDAAYCAKIGFTDGRSICPVRPEGNPERSACEAYVTGRAADTGRAGPTWYFGGSFCTGRPTCENHPDNQYQLVVYAGGLYRACARSGVCGEVQADK
jgi:hypothetical protein